MGMTQAQMDQWLTSKVETIVAEQLGNITQQLEDLFNQSLEAYTATIVAGKIAGKLDDELVKAYERMVLAEAKRITFHDTEEETGWVRDEPTSDEETLEETLGDLSAAVHDEPTPRPKLKQQRIDAVAKSLEGGMDWPEDED